MVILGQAPAPKGSDRTIPPAPPLEMIKARRDGSTEAGSATASKKVGKVELIDFSKMEKATRDELKGNGIFSLYRASMPDATLDFGYDEKNSLRWINNDKGDPLINLKEGEMEGAKSGWNSMKEDGTFTKLPHDNILFYPKLGLFMHGGIPSLGEDPNRAYKTNFIDGTTVEGKFVDNGQGGKKFVAEKPVIAGGAADAAKGGSTKSDSTETKSAPGNGAAPKVVPGTLHEALEKAKAQGATAEQLREIRKNYQAQKDQQKTQTPKDADKKAAEKTVAPAQGPAKVDSAAAAAARVHAEDAAKAEAAARNAVAARAAMEAARVAGMDKAFPKDAFGWTATQIIERAKTAKQLDEGFPIENFAGNNKKAAEGVIEVKKATDKSDLDARIDTRATAWHGKLGSHTFAYRNNELVRVGAVELGKGVDAKDVNRDIYYKFTDEKDLQDHGLTGKEPGWYSKNTKGEWLREKNQHILFLPTDGLYLAQDGPNSGLGVNFKDGTAFSVKLDAGTHIFSRESADGTTKSSWWVPQIAKPPVKPQVVDAKSGKQQGADKKPELTQAEKEAKIERAYNGLKAAKTDLDQNLKLVDKAINVSGIRQAMEKGKLPADILERIVDADELNRVEGAIKESFDKDFYDGGRPNISVAEERLAALQDGAGFVTDTIDAAREVVNDKSLTEDQRKILSGLINTDLLKIVAENNLPTMEEMLDDTDVALHPELAAEKLAQAEAEAKAKAKPAEVVIKPESEKDKQKVNEQAKPTDKSAEAEQAKLQDVLDELDETEEQLTHGLESFDTATEKLGDANDNDLLPEGMVDRIANGEKLQARITAVEAADKSIEDAQEAGEPLSMEMVEQRAKALSELSAFLKKSNEVLKTELASPAVQQRIKDGKIPVERELVNPREINKFRASLTKASDSLTSANKLIDEAKTAKKTADAGKPDAAKVAADKAKAEKAAAEKAAAESAAKDKSKTEKAKPAEKPVETEQTKLNAARQGLLTSEEDFSAAFKSFDVATSGLIAAIKSGSLPKEIAGQIVNQQKLVEFLKDYGTSSEEMRKALATNSVSAEMLERRAQVISKLSDLLKTSEQKLKEKMADPEIQKKIKTELAKPEVQKIIKADLAKPNMQKVREELAKPEIRKLIQEGKFPPDGKPDEQLRALASKLVEKGDAALAEATKLIGEAKALAKAAPKAETGQPVRVGPTVEKEDEQRKRGIQAQNRSQSAKSAAERARERRRK